MSTVDAKYALSGNFLNPAGRASFFGSLATIDGIDLFYHYQNSDVAANFQLGVPLNPLDQLMGSLTGTLAAGESYLFGVSAITDSGPPDSQGTATGSMVLTIVPVPEPANSLYLLSGLFVAAFVWVRSARCTAQWAWQTSR